MLEFELAINRPGPQPGWRDLCLGGESGIAVLHSENGAGTSTLLRALAGRLPAGWTATGRAVLDGRPLVLDDPRVIHLDHQSELRSSERVGDAVLRAAGRRRSGAGEPEGLFAELGLAEWSECRLQDCPPPVRHRARLAGGLTAAVRAASGEGPGSGARGAAARGTGARGPGAHGVVSRGAGGSLLLVDQLLSTQPTRWRLPVVRQLAWAAGQGVTILWADHADEITAITEGAESAGAAGNARAAAPVGRAFRLSNIGLEPEGRRPENQRPSATRPETPTPRDRPRQPGSTGGSSVDPAMARLQGERFTVHPGEVVGVLADDPRDADRLVRAWHRQGTGRPTDLALAVLLQQLPLEQVIARWAEDDGELLRRCARVVSGLRPKARAIDHSAGEMAALRNELLLDDELAAVTDPSRGLGPTARRALVARLERRARSGSATLLSITDEDFAARACTRLVRITDGRIIDGPAAGGPVVGGSVNPSVGGEAAVNPGASHNDPPAAATPAHAVAGHPLATTGSGIRDA